MLFSIPEPLPPDGTEAQTGVACPECAGTLIMLVRKDFAAFRCRIGHAYSLPEVLASMEETVERRLWNVVASMEELADFLAVASGEHLAHVEPNAFRQRSISVRDHAKVLRSVIESERPLRLNGAAPTTPDTP